MLKRADHHRMYRVSNYSGESPKLHLFRLDPSHLLYNLMSSYCNYTRLESSKSYAR